MKKHRVLTSLFIFFFTAATIVSLLLVLLKPVSQYALSLYLEKNVTVRSIELTTDTLKLNAVIEHDSTLEGTVHFDFSGTYDVNATYCGYADNFSGIAGVPLPKIYGDVALTIDTQGQLRSSGKLLDSNVSFDLDLETMAFAFSSPDLLLEQLFSELNTTRYLHGRIDINSSGILKEPYAFQASLASNHTSVDTELQKILNPKLKKSPEIELRLNVALEKELLTADLSTKSALFDLDARRLEYNITDNTFYIDAKAKEFSGNLEVNLTEALALRGKFDFDEGTHLRLESEALESPIDIAFNEGKIDAKSHRFSMNALLQMLSQKPLAFTPKMSFEASIDTAENASFTVDSRIHDIPFLDQNFTLTLNAVMRDGTVIASPYFKAPFGTLEHGEITYNTKNSHLTSDLNIKHLQLPSFQANDLSARIEANIKDTLIAKGRFQTPNETLTVEHLRFKDDALRSSFAFSLKNPSRFSKSLESAYRLSGNGYLSYYKNELRSSIDTDKLGKFDLIYTRDKTSLTGVNIPLEQVLVLLKQKPLLNGELKLDAAKNGNTYTVAVSSEVIKPKEASLNIRPFPLNVNATLQHNNTILSADAQLNTYNETLKLKEFRYDMRTNTLKSRFAFTSMLLDESTYKLSKSIQGRLVFNGLAAVDIDHGTYALNAYALSYMIDRRINFDIAGSYKEKLTVKGDIATKYEKLTLKSFYYNLKSRAYGSTFALDLTQTPQKKKYYHGTLLLDGDVTSLPLPRLNVKTASFDGLLQATIDKNTTTLTGRKLALTKLARFFEYASGVQQGNIDINTTLSSNILTDNNLSHLNGDVNIEATGVIINGININNSINNLKSTQDLSLFNDSYPGEGLINAITSAPSAIISSSVKSTTIPFAVFEANISNGVLECIDCAATTDQNRAALQANVTLQSEKINYAVLGLLNDQNCAYFAQQITGTLSHPKFSVLGASFDILTGSVISVASNVSGAARFATGTLSSAVNTAGSAIDNTLGKIPLLGDITSLFTSTTEDSTSEINSLTQQTKTCTRFYNGIVKAPSFYRKKGN